MYKVYINSLLNELTNHCYAISINQLSLPSPSFADGIALLALYPTFLTSLMGMCYKYSTKWRYEINHTKSGVVTYGETKPVHFEEMKEREWILGDGTVDELYEYKNLGVLKNYIGSFSSSVEDNIDKTRKKAGMIFSSNFDRRLLYTSSLEPNMPAPPYCMALSSLLLHYLHLQNFNNVSNGSSTIFSMYQTPLP